MDKNTPVENAATQVKSVEPQKIVTADRKSPGDSARKAVRVSPAKEKRG